MLLFGLFRLVIGRTQNKHQPNNNWLWGSRIEGMIFTAIGASGLLSLAIPSLYVIHKSLLVITFIALCVYACIRDGGF